MRREDMARALNVARQSHHLSIRAAAKIAGVPATTVQGWLSGRHLPTPALRPNFERLVAALDLAEQFPASSWAADESLDQLRIGRAPYLGLRPFSAGDAEYFHGRDAEARRLAITIAEQAPHHGLVAVVGPSGCGKSSLLAAGLIAHHCTPGGLLADRHACQVTWDHLDVGVAILFIDASLQNLFFSHQKINP